MLAEIAEQFTDEQKKKVEKAIDVITHVSGKITEDIRKQLFKSIGMFIGKSAWSFHTILLDSDEVDFDDADEVALSMEKGELRTEIIRRLKINGLFNINEDA